MTRVEPECARFEVECSNEGLRIIIPTRRRILLIFFLGFWLCGWVMGEVTVIQHLASDQALKNEGLFLLAWLGAWTMGGIFAILTWLNLISGREVVQLNERAISLSREVLGVGRPKEFDLANVADLRLSVQPYNPMDWNSGLQFWGLGGGILAFDYGAKTFRFGAGLDESEGKLILARIHDWIRGRGRLASH